MQNAPLKSPAAARNKPVDEAKVTATPPIPPDAIPPTPRAPTTETAIGRLQAAQGDAPLPPYTPEPTQRLAPEPPRSEAVDKTLNVPAGWMYVLDTSAHDVERVHEQIVRGSIKKIVFPPRRPLPLPPDLAVKFLAKEGFMLTDEDGDPIEWNATPRQPHEMGAGENISLGPAEVIASLDELNNGSLRKRALQLGASEAAMTAERDDLIGFIKQKTQEFRRQKRNGGKGVADDPGGDVDVEEFVPSADMLPESAHTDRFML